MQMQDIYQDFKCIHCGGMTHGTTNEQVVHASDCQTLIAYSEILKVDPEAVMEEDLVPSGMPYTLSGDKRIEVQLR